MVAALVVQDRTDHRVLHATPVLADCDETGNRPARHRKQNSSLPRRYAAHFRKVVGLHHELQGDKALVDSALLLKLVSEATAAGIQQFVVGAVVQSQDEVLLLHRPEDDFMGGLWELPSGKVEPGEAFDEALVREVKEETGLDVAAVQRYLGSFDYTSGSGKASRQFNFAVDVTATRSIELHEHDVYQWAQLDGDLPVTAPSKPP